MDKKNLQELAKMGLSKKTISLMTESEVKLLFEKINKKKETKEATQDVEKKTTLDKSDVFNNVKVSDMESLLKKAPLVKKETNKPLDTKNVKPSEITGEVKEGKKKKKKYNPWAVCTASVGRKDKKKYEDCVMGVKKKLKEGKDPYEYIIESKMEEIVENNLSPKLSKSEILRIIAEKKMEMKKPIGKMTTMSMAENTETAPAKPKEKEKVREKPSHPGRKEREQPNPKPRAGTETAPVKAPPKTKPDTKPSHPGRKEKDQPNPKPRASSSEMESKKSEIITAIFNLIDKENK